MQRVYNLPALTRVTVSAADVPELTGTSFGTILSTGPGVVAERTMGWDVGGAMAGGHTAKAIVAPSQTWYLAEGNAGFFDTFVLLVNPQDAPTNVTVDFLLDDGQVVSRTYTLPALGRLYDLRERDPRAADAFVRHDGPRRQADPVRARDVLQERRHDVPRRPLVGGRAVGIDALVPRGRADGRLLRDVRAARESESASRWK